MKYFLFLIFTFLITNQAFSQYELRAGMGIDFLTTPSLNDYINQNFAPPDQQISTFSTAVEFSGEAGYMINQYYQVGLELAYLINSHTFTYNIGKYDFAYHVIMPTIMNYYVLQGSGYKFKFGGGIGIRLSDASETLPTSTISKSYSAFGFGFILRADANTLISKDLYVNLGGDLRYDLNGEPKNGSNYLVNNVNGSNVNLNSFSADVRLGIMYLF